jgi:DNA-binding transcriptional regulator of glucitol operon
LAFTRQWLGGLALCILFAVIFAWLGRWQWNRGQAAHGSLQNTAYAFNWWLFSLLSLGFWGRTLRDAAREVGLPRQVDEAGAYGALVQEAQRATAVAADAADPEVVAWNAWLTELNANPRR